LNGAGWGQPRPSAPASQAPALQVPGKPVALTVQAGTHSGYLSLRFDPPRVPKHGVPCFGGSSAKPAKCPTPVGAFEDSANGGAEVSGYQVEWSIDPAFSATQSDSGRVLVDASVSAYTARDLTQGRRYYVRVAARNLMGFSAFCAEAGGDCSSGTPASAVTS
jgi:hypothetical protein